MSRKLCDKKKSSKGPTKEKLKLFSTNSYVESRSAKSFPSPEHDDIEGFSSSASENLENVEENLRKDQISWLSNSHKRVDELHSSDFDECEKIAWSSNSSHDSEMSSDQTEIDDIVDASFTQNSPPKKSLNHTIKEYGSDDEEGRSVNPVLKKENISQDTIEELSPSPVVMKATTMPLTDKTEFPLKGGKDSSFYGEYESDEEDVKKKKRKIAKGGLTERLIKIQSHEKSDLAFWKHTKTKLAEDATFVIQVTTVETAYSNSSLCCKLFDDITLYVILPASYTKQLRIKPDCILRIYPPWKKIICKDLNSLVILCAYHIEMLNVESSLIKTNAAQELISFHQKHRHNDKELNENEENMNISTLETTYLVRSPQKQEHLTITEAVEKNGYAKYVSFCGMIQRVLCRLVAGVSDEKGTFVEKIMLSQEKDNKEKRYGLLIQDNEGAVCEITIPHSVIQKRSAWRRVIVEGEGSVCSFKSLRLLKRRPHNRFSSLHSMVHSISPTQDMKINLEAAERADSIEEASTQSYDGSVTASSYLFTIDESISQVDTNNIPESFKFSYSPCIEFASLMNNSSDDGRYILYLKVLTISSNNGGDCSWSTIFENQCLIYGSCVSNKCSNIHKVKKLSSCFIPDAIARKLDNKHKDIHICLKDLYVHNNELIADAYTRIYILKQDSSPEDMFSMTYEPVMREKIPAAKIPSLNLSHKEGDLIIAQGVVCGVDEETALFWNVCAQCQSDDILENDEKGIWCHLCEKETSTQLNMQLDIFLYIASMPAICILCKLLKSTISTLLPAPTGSDFEGYDMNKILNKRFGPSLCQIVDLVAPSKENSESKIFLKEVNHFGEYTIC